MSTAALVLSLLSLSSCDLLGEDGDLKKGQLPEGAVIAGVMGGDEPALWLFDPMTLNRIDTIETDGRQPTGLAFSPDDERWFLNWQTGSHLEGNARNVLAIVAPSRGDVLKRSTSDLSIGGGSLLYEPTNDRLLAYRPSVQGEIQLFDPETLELVGRHSIGDSRSYVAEAVASPKRKSVYLGANTGGPPAIYVYDAPRDTLSHTIVLTQEQGLDHSAIIDIGIGPDERYLYATTYLSPGGPGGFFMVDLETEEVLFEGRAGVRADLAVHPGGRYVYIDCPAGGMRNLNPTNQILRFDAKKREMDVFINGAEDMGLDGEGLIASHITMLPGGGSFLLVGAGDVSLTRVNTESGQVIASYTHPRNERGYITKRFAKLRMGRVPD